MVADVNKIMMGLMGSLETQPSEADSYEPVEEPEPIDMMAEANKRMMEIMGMSGQGKSMPSDYVPKTGDWRCPTCDCFVFAKKPVCTSCGTANPDLPADPPDP